jgi:hypothetical protein
MWVPGPYLPVEERDGWCAQVAEFSLELGVSGGEGR